MIYVEEIRIIKIDVQGNLKVRLEYKFIYSSATKFVSRKVNEILKFKQKKQQT